jgi:isopenicillin-N epimerase
MSWTPGSPEIKARWGLDPDVTFLNHGSFGATPRTVLVAQRRWQEEMEREPVLFLARRLEGLLHDVRTRVADFVGADPAGLALVPNATTGVNAVVRSLRWDPGDEILLADMSYNAVKQTIRYLADSCGVVPVEARIPFPLTDPAEITAAFAARITPRTRLLLVDHVVSATALVCPVEELVALARRHGIPILVDGAHAPGMLPLRIDALAPDFYTGNLHKWAFAPKGCALLWVAPEWRGRIHPMTISHGYGTGFHHEFDWTGTIDPSAWLAIPDGLDAWAALPGLPEASHALVRRGREVIAAALGTPLPHPDDPRLYGTLAAIAMPGTWDGDFAKLSARTAALYEVHRIEVPFMAYDARIWVRVSGNAYNAPSDYERLAEALRERA